MGTRSFRFRLTIWYAAVLTAGLGLFGSLVWLSLRHQLMADLERDLNGTASRVESFFRSESAEAGVQVREELEEFSQALPPASYLSLRGSKGFAFRYPPIPPAAAMPFRVQKRNFTVNDEAFDLEVGASLADMNHVLKLLWLLLWSLLPVVIIMACVGGAWLSGRALKPVREVTDAALTISIENLSKRLPVPASGDEIARLATVLNSMLARLEAAVTKLSQFAGDASHELRTPLAVIRTTAELALRRERSPESYRAALAEVAGESERMTHLVDALLTLARGDAGAVEMPRAAIDVREVLTAVSREMESLAEAPGVRVTTVLGERPAIISGNRDALRRLFMVLLDNAIKYSPVGGEVILRVDRGEGQVSASVEDFGEGIGSADLPHIFDRFYQADHSRGAGGHGLGLSLAQSIARTHGVEIGVSSIRGKGSTFRVDFPERAKPLSQSSASPATVSSQHSPGTLERSART